MHLYKRSNTPPFQRCKWMFGFSFAKKLILELLQVCVCQICCLDGLLFVWQKKPSTIQPYGIMSGEHNHSINQYHISLWDIKCFVVTECKTSKINILPVIWQCAMHQISLRTQRIISQERILNKRWGGGSKRGLGVLGNVHLASQSVATWVGALAKSPSTNVGCLEH